MLKNVLKLKELKKTKELQKRDGHRYYADPKHSENLHESALENNGTAWMLKDVGRGNLKFAKRWGWLYRQYTWASRVALFPDQAVVLDIGCDVGELQSVINRSFYCKNPMYIGIDLDGKRLQSAFDNLATRTPTVFINHDITFGLKFVKSTSVDFVFFGEIIEHLKEEYIPMVLREIKRVLKPGGKFILSTPNVENSDGYEWHIKEFTIPELTALVEATGFKVVTVYGWLTKRKLLEKSQKAVRQYKRMCKHTHKDIALNIIAHAFPELSDSICMEAEKPDEN